MYCPVCGEKLNDGAAVCKSCGAPVLAEKETAAEKEKPAQPAPPENGGITLGDDGVYRWYYEMPLLKNPTLFTLVWKIFFFVLLGIFAVTTVVDAIDWGDAFFPEHLLINLRFFGYFLLGMTVVTALGYLLYAAIMGGKYCVSFEMDENGVNHKQIPKQAKKAQKIAAATALAGLAAGRLTTVGVGLNASRTEMYSDFSRTRKVKAYPRLHVIKVNGRLSHNQVYAGKEDFAFVRDYIVSHCENLK